MRPCPGRPKEHARLPRRPEVQRHHDVGVEPPAPSTQRARRAVFYNHARGREKRTNVGAIDARVRLPAHRGLRAEQDQAGEGRRPTAVAGHGRADLPRSSALLEREWRRPPARPVRQRRRLQRLLAVLGVPPRLGARRDALDLAAQRPQGRPVREVDGKRPQYDNLGAVFSSYSRFDHLVSVSPALRDINAANLAEFAPPEKFVSARNTIDHERILRKAYGDRALLEAWPGDHVLELGPHRSPTRWRPSSKHELSACGTRSSGGWRWRCWPRPRTASRRSSPSAGSRRRRTTRGCWRPSPRSTANPDDPAGRHRQRARWLPTLRATGRATWGCDGRHLHRPQPNPWAIMAPVRLLRALQRLRGPADGDPRGHGARPARGVTAFGSVVVGAAAGRGLVVDRDAAALADGLTGPRGRGAQPAVRPRGLQRPGHGGVLPRHRAPRALTGRGRAEGPVSA